MRQHAQTWLTQQSEMQTKVSHVGLHQFHPCMALCDTHQWKRSKYMAVRYTNRESLFFKNHLHPSTKTSVRNRDDIYEYLMRRSMCHQPAVTVLAVSTLDLSAVLPVLRTHR